ncbi:hypothetical protein [Natronomonas sp. EA1]|uniref:hypothetical protein n=1 Tax=Natronomonas sp. EA1 TaxID=3421655 RepID=UPI003EBF60A7
MDDHTTGYLFPSMRSSTGHISDATVYRRFVSLAGRANVRKLWYTSYASVIEEVAEQMTGIAAFQGSDDVHTVLKHYVDEARTVGTSTGTDSGMAARDIRRGRIVGVESEYLWATQ